MTNITMKAEAVGNGKPTADALSRIISNFPPDASVSVETGSDYRESWWKVTATWIVDTDTNKPGHAFKPGVRDAGNFDSLYAPGTK